MSVATPSLLLRAQSGAADTAQAMAELLGKLPLADLSALVLFVGEGHDLRAIEQALAPLPRDLAILGCTTAGEIGAGGYLQGHLVALGFPRALFRVATGLLPNLGSFQPEIARDLAFELRAELTFSTADWTN